jgi:hypothetical protein
MSKFIKIGERFINPEQIVSIISDGKLFTISLSNGAIHKAEVNKQNKKIVLDILSGKNAEL